MTDRKAREHMTLVSEAFVFAAKAHDGMVRKGTDIPYIVHPAEAAAIAASITNDEEVIAAAVLHDVIEDCGVTAQELSARFSPRVAEIVLAESETKDDAPRESWDRRKQETIDKLSRSGRDERIVALCDKLSNMRAISRDYDRDGEAIFFRFHQHDKRRHAWYYRSCAELMCAELGTTDAYKELVSLIEYVFGSAAQDAAESTQRNGCAV